MKKILGMLIALTLVLAMLPISAFAADNYIVAGDAALCGSNWAPSDTNNAMTLDGDVYVKVYTNVPVGNYAFKVTDGTWDNSWGDGGNNYMFANTAVGDVTITFDPATKEITVTGAGIGAVQFEANSITAVGTGKNGFLNNVEWKEAEASNHMTNDGGVWTITYTGVGAGTYDFKFAANDAWTDSWGTGAAVNNDEWHDAYYNGQDSKLTVENDDSTVTLSLDLSAFDYGTKSGAKLKATVTAPTTEPDPDPGVDENKLVLGDNVDKACGNYTYTATADGKLTITVTKLATYNANTDKWSNGDLKLFFENIFRHRLVVNGTDVKKATYELDVVAGDVVAISLESTKNEETKATINLAFEAAFNGEIVTSEIASGSATLASAANDESKTVEFTAPADGVMTVIMGETTPGWAYQVHNADGTSTLLITGNESASADYDVKKGGTYQVQMWSYDKNGYTQGNGQIFYEIKYTPSSGDQEIQVQDYVISSTILVLGENNVTLEENAITTIYEFTPEEAGTYRFTASDSNALVGYWGAGSFYLSDFTLVKTNTLEYTLSFVGQSIMVGVSGVDGCTINVEKIADYVEQEVEEVIYENQHEFGNYEYDQEKIKPIDIFDEEEDVAVVGEDGFYHYGSANGPIIVVDLTALPIDIADAYTYGQLAATITGEDGKATKYDYNDAMMEYYDMGLYPVTEELGMMLQQIGEAKAWYVEGGFMYPDNAPADAETAWLGVCSYVEGTETEDNGGNNGGNNNGGNNGGNNNGGNNGGNNNGGNNGGKPGAGPVTGDASIAGLAVAVMLAGAGLVFLKKKKF